MIEYTAARAWNKEEGDMEKARSRKLTVKDMAQVGMMTALLVVCAWVTIPFTIPFTLQTFGVFMSLRLLGGRRGTAAIGLYILLGIAGVPVFSGFGAGFGVIAGPTGGYIAGFILTGLLYCAAAPLRKTRLRENLVLACGLILCYAFGTAWFCVVKGNAGSPVDFLRALSICVLPYLLPDAVKLLLADQIATRVRKALG